LLISVLRIISGIIDVRFLKFKWSQGGAQLLPVQDAEPQPLQIGSA